ncbi:MAG: IS3 family transposase [Burkholderia sp.]
MSRTISTIGKPFGLQQVCQVLDFPRGTIYVERTRLLSNVAQLTPMRRGPKPKGSDRELLEAIRADLARTSFVGEGARKVWARLRIQDDIRVSRARVSPLMREHGWLSPHRRPQKSPNAHDGRITTDRSNEMWGTGGAKVQTVDEGLAWIFAAVDHCDAACVGIHVTKVGDHFAALEPISQGVHEQFGSVEADAGRRLSLRIDHGSQYTSDDFRAQIKFWEITLSYAFVAEPQTNGVAERFNYWTMKE